MKNPQTLLALAAVLVLALAATTPAHAQIEKTSYTMYIGQDSVGVETVSMAPAADGSLVYKSKIEADMSDTKVQSTARTVVFGDDLVVQSIDVNGDISRGGQTTAVRVIGTRDGESLAIEASMGGQSMNMSLPLPETAIVSNRFMCQHAIIFIERLSKSGWFDDPSTPLELPVAELGPPHATEIEVQPGVTAGTGQLNGNDIATLSFVARIDGVDLAFTVAADDRRYLRLRQESGGLTIVREGYGPAFEESSSTEAEDEEDTPKRRRRR